MQNVFAVAIVVVALIVLILAARSASKRSRGGWTGTSPAKSRGAGSAKAGPSFPVGDELVAVIAAAVSSASGMESGSFRIVGISPSEAPITERGFNTPVWGHVDRFKRGE